MDQNELEGMAERCGWGQGNTWDDCMCCSTFDLEAFAKLVADVAVAKAVEREREACAVTAEEHFCGCGRGNCPEEDVRAHEIAQAIRARGTEA